jgi:hypothetical protein
MIYDNGQLIIVPSGIDWYSFVKKSFAMLNSVVG